MATHCRYPHLGKTGSLVVVGLVYVAALILGVQAAGLWPALNPVGWALVVDVVATLVVFMFSAWYRNASVYDPYWSVAPILIVVYWSFAGEIRNAVPLRQGLVILLVWAWGLRLTWNWIARWRGLGDEDWRYTRLRQRSGRAYPLVNLAGIHLMPTVLVFLGCLPLWAAVADSVQDLNWLDGVACVVTSAAIWLEWRADRELRQHRERSGVGVLDTGLWARFRHPNYLGEIIFWWGLYLFALAANPDLWWSIIGALSITALFVFVSIPMMDKRMAGRTSKP